jgi:hypothetical protein
MEVQHGFACSGDVNADKSVKARVYDSGIGNIECFLFEPGARTFSPRGNDPRAVRCHSNVPRHLGAYVLQWLNRLLVSRALAPTPSRLRFIALPGSIRIPL